MLFWGFGLIVLLLLYVLSGNRTRLKKNILFNGVTFKHREKSQCGWVIRHYYTSEELDIYSSREMLHILEFNKNIVRQYWRKPLTSLICQYGLKTIGRDEYEMAGSFKRLGIEMQSYGVPINVNGQEHLAFYITRESSTDLSKIEILNELSSISV